MHIDNVIFLILSKIAYTKFSEGPRHADGNLRNLLHANVTDADQVVTLTSNDDHLHEPIENAQRQHSAELQFVVSYARILLE